MNEELCFLLFTLKRYTRGIFLANGILLNNIQVKLSENTF